MNIYLMRAFVAFLLAPLLIISCTNDLAVHDIAATTTIAPSPSPTKLPYWDLLPLDWEPPGGWTPLVLEEADVSFQISYIYQTGECGKLYTFYKDVANYKAQVIGFEGSRIQLHVYSEWETDWEKFLNEGQARQGISLVTSIEQISLGGIPAYRYITTTPSTKMMLYYKGASAYYHDKLYSFSYISAPYLLSCDAYPLSEEQVYEYLISTVEFLE